MNPETDEIIDEVMVSVLIAPKTFTKEDIIEINCHGGIVAVNHVLNIVLKNGARLAEPGEFTKRAFLNRSEEHTSELQSRGHLVCRLLLEKKKMKSTKN